MHQLNAIVAGGLTLYLLCACIQDVLCNWGDSPYGWGMMPGHYVPGLAWSIVSWFAPQLGFFGQENVAPFLGRR